MSLKSGTKAMDKKDLSISELSTIIEACCKHNVRSLQYKNLAITFHAPSQEGVVLTSHSRPSEANSMDTEISTNESAMEEAESGILMVEDPVEYERVQASRHIERLRNEKTQII